MAEFSDGNSLGEKEAASLVGISPSPGRERDQARDLKRRKIYATIQGIPVKKIFH